MRRGSWRKTERSTESVNLKRLASGQEEKVWDVVIVGGGPAGSTLANSLRLSDPSLSVCVVDRARFPRDKPCGDGISPGAVAILRDLQVDGILAGYAPVDVLIVRSPGGSTSKGPLPEVNGSSPMGYVIPRATFDDHLLSAARLRGAVVLEGTTFEDASTEAATGHWSIHVRRDDAAGVVLRSRILIGADGARSSVRRLLGVPFNTARHTGVALRAYGHLREADEAALLLDFKRDLLPAYGWTFPVTGDLVNVGVGIDVPRYKTSRKNLKDIAAIFFGHIANEVDVDLATCRASMIPYGSYLPRLAHVRAALIGDAGSMVNPLTGEGIYYGMWAGAWLGRELPAAIRANKVESGLRHFEKVFRDHFSEHFRTNRLMKIMVTNRFWCDIVIRAAARDQRVLAKSIYLMMGGGRRLTLPDIFLALRRGLWR